LLLVVLLFPSAWLSLHKYIDHQVINSLRNIVTVDSRFDIVKRLFFELTPAAVLCILLLVWTRIRKSVAVLMKENIKKAMVFVSLGLTGVFPIMISMKQSGFYIISVYPFFAIGAGILVYPVIDSLFIKMNYESKWFLIFKWIGYGLFFAGIVLSLYFHNRFSRDNIKIKETYMILAEIPQGSIININPDMFEDWSLHAYFARFKNVSLDPDLENNREYLLIKNEYNSDTLNSRYEMIKINTTEYKLYRKK
jgi:hypothetical protein